MKILNFLNENRRYALIVGGLIVLVLYCYDLTGNPPGFYLDESLISYNAYHLYLTGRGEFGPTLPLYFPVLQIPPPHDFLGYADPVQVYLLAFLYFFFPPSIFLARFLSVAGIMAATILMGRLAVRISGRLALGVAVALVALATPWFFEISRLAFASALYPLAVVLLLTILYRVNRKERWSALEYVGIALALALCTYTYSIGRLLGPLLAFGLIVFATDINRFKAVLRAWGAYAVTLIPLAIFHFSNPNALTGRYNMSVGIIKPDMGYWDVLLTFLGNVFQNIGLRRLLLIGDPNLRHHITDTPAIFVAMLLLAIAGIVLVVLRLRRDAWWRYILYGLVASLVPASLTVDHFHSLRLVAFPVFLTLLMVPALQWLFSDDGETADGQAPRNFTRNPAKKLALGLLLLSVILQTLSFQESYRDLGGVKRGLWFDDAYPTVFEATVAMEQRPIYLVDGAWGQAYLHAYWYATVKGVDLSNFVHMKEGVRPPPEALVLSSEEKCLNCKMIQKAGTYLLYTEGGAAVDPLAPPASKGVFDGGKGTGKAQFQFPHGVAVDRVGNVYVADSDNARVQKFSPDGAFSAVIGQDVLKSPKGIVILGDEILVADNIANTIVRFRLSDLSPLPPFTGPPEGFSAPVDIAVGESNSLIIVDQGTARIVRLSATGEFLGAWGGVGEGPGEFRQITGVSQGGGRVFVADARNSRIQVLDTSAKFISQIPVPEWEAGDGTWQSPDVLYDPATQRLFVSSTNTHEVLIFDKDLKRIGKISEDLSGPTSLSLGPEGKLFILNTLTARVTVVPAKK
ncbi:MAG: hypothetical protein WKF34_02750 [Pyrinomonadaceae bacterium]